MLELSMVLNHVVRCYVRKTQRIIRGLWFKMRLLPNLSEKCVIILDNASHHSRQVEKTATMSTLKREMVKSLLEYGIKIHQPTPIKAVLLERIKMPSIKKHYIIDQMALERGHRGHRVLRLSLPPPPTVA